ncbi:MAG TPA: hypothetical protein DIT25_02540 [Candidatus Moranbacteria bacterium]|nr:hypothetical protein [Candidatus Moranbacteria bacterium]
MEKFWRKYSNSASIVIFFMLIPAVFFWSVLPLAKDIRMNSEEIQKKMIDDNLNRARISKIPEMEKLGTMLSENKERLDVIMSGSSEVDFIRNIESLAEETQNKIDLKIEDASAPKQRTAPVKKDESEIKNSLLYESFFTMQIIVEGKFANVVNFMHKLENSGYYANILSLSLSKVDVDPSGSPPARNAARDPFRDGKNANMAKEQAIRAVLEVAVYTRN